MMTACNFVNNHILLLLEFGIFQWESKRPYSFIRLVFVLP